MATPPRMRQATKIGEGVASPLPREVTAKSSAEPGSAVACGRTGRSSPGDHGPAQTTKQRATVRPALQALGLVRSKYRSKNGLAPPITTQS